MEQMIGCGTVHNEGDLVAPREKYFTNDITAPQNMFRYSVARGTGMKIELIKLSCIIVLLMTNQEETT